MTDGLVIFGALVTVLTFAIFSLRLFRWVLALFGFGR
jgi:hypothetical protein